MRFLLDLDVPADLALQLRLRGHDAVRLSVTAAGASQFLTTHQAGRLVHGWRRPKGAGG